MNVRPYWNLLNVRLISVHYKLTPENISFDEFHIMFTADALSKFNGFQLDLSLKNAVDN